MDQQNDPLAISDTSPNCLNSGTTPSTSEGQAPAAAETNNSLPTAANQEPVTSIISEMKEDPSIWSSAESPPAPLAGEMTYLRDGIHPPGLVQVKLDPLIYDLSIVDDLFDIPENLPLFQMPNRDPETSTTIPTPAVQLTPLDLTVVKPDTQEADKAPVPSTSGASATPVASATAATEQQEAVPASPAPGPEPSQAQASQDQPPAYEIVPQPEPRAPIINFEPGQAPRVEKLTLRKIQDLQQPASSSNDSDKPNTGKSKKAPRIRAPSGDRPNRSGSRPDRPVHDRLGPHRNRHDIAELVRRLDKLEEVTKNLHHRINDQQRRINTLNGQLTFRRPEQNTNHNPYHWQRRGAPRRYYDRDSY